MRIGIVVCSSSDLPSSFIKQHDINVMPITLTFKDKEIIDIRDPDVTKAFYTDYLTNKDLSAESEAFSSEQIRDWFLKELVLKYDRILVLTIMSSRTPIFKNSTDASFAILNGYRDIRRKAGVKGSFSLRVLDTKNLFAAEAIAAHEAIRLIKEENISFANLRTRMETLFSQTYAYMVPKDLYHLRNKASKKGERNIGLVSYALAKSLKIIPVMQGHNGATEILTRAKGYDDALDKLFDHTRWQIENGLKVPTICMSYAGHLEEFTQRDDYQKFIAFCEKKKVTYTMAMMSVTAGINVGPGSFSLAFVKDGLTK